MTEEQRQYQDYAGVKLRLWGKPSKKNVLVDMRAEEMAREQERELARKIEKQKIEQANARLEIARRAARLRHLKHDLKKFSTTAHITVGADQFQLHESASAGTRPSMEQIAYSVLDKYLGVTLDEVKSASRIRIIVMARREIIVRIRQIRPDISFPRIGAFLCKDHSSCVNAWQQWEKEHMK